MLCTVIVCFLVVRASIAVCKRSTVACLRAVVEACRAASCASEGVREARGFRDLVSFFMAFLSSATRCGKHFVQGNVGTVCLSLSLQAHHIDHIIKLLNFDPRLPRIDKVPLRLKQFCLFRVRGSPRECRTHSFRVRHQVGATQAKRPVVPTWTEARTPAVAQCRWMKGMPQLKHRTQILIHLFHVALGRCSVRERVVKFFLLV